MSTDGRLTRALTTRDLAVYYLSSLSGWVRPRGAGDRTEQGRSGRPGRPAAGDDRAGRELTPDGRLLLHATATEGTETHEVRYAVLATGRRPVPPPFDLDLQDRVEVDGAGGMIIDADYSVRWKGSGDSRIHALNRARLSHGIPDANLTLLPVRAAPVLNSMLERQLFTVLDDALPVRW